MDRLSWPTAVKVIVGLMVAGFVAGIVLFVVQVYELTGPFPAETFDFVTDIQAGNEYISARYPLDFASSALFAMGFAAFGLLGPLLARLAVPGDSRGPILTGTLLLAGGLGVAAQLVYVGATPVATSTQYCDCGLLAEELMSRLMAYNIVQGIQTWLNNGAIIAAAAGLVVAARPGVRAGMPVGWAYLGYLTALGGIIVAVLWAFSRDTFPFNLWSLVVLSAILLPAWAIWLAMRSEDLRIGTDEGGLLEGKDSAT
jgi:MFS family permease